jgi:hypothetical protein
MPTTTPARRYRTPLVAVALLASAVLGGCSSGNSAPDAEKAKLLTKAMELMNGGNTFDEYEQAAYKCLDGKMSKSTLRSILTWHDRNGSFNDEAKPMFAAYEKCAGVPVDLPGDQ